MWRRRIPSAAALLAPPPLRPSCRPCRARGASGCLLGDLGTSAAACAAARGRSFLRRLAFTVARRAAAQRSPRAAFRFARRCDHRDRSGSTYRTRTRCWSITSPQLLENGRVLERRDVLRDLIAARDGLEQPPHDLARAGFGQ